MIEIIDTETGETMKVKGTLMVATNGTIFVKQGNKTVFASSSPNYVCKDLS